jgi:MFS family permease
MSGAVIFVLLARDLHLSPGIIGLLTSVSAIGGLIGSLIAARFARWVGQGPAIWIAALAFAPGAFAAPFLHRNWTLALFAAGSLLTWVANVVYNITQVSFRQAITPERMQGRMNATMRFIVWGTIPIGAIIGGAIATVSGVSTAIWVGALGSFLAVIPLVITPVRTLREMPMPIDEGTATTVEPAPGS